MFTSRAEYRLLLREDNADLRLTEKGRTLGLVADKQWRAFETKEAGIEAEKKRLSQLWTIRREITALELLRRPEVTYEHLLRLSPVASTIVPLEIQQQIEIQQKYGGYIERQQMEIARLRRYEETVLPADFDYTLAKGLSNEVRQKLIEHRPTTIGQASRMPGITPAAISLLLVYLKKAS